MHPESLLHAIISDNLLGNGHLPSIGARCLSYFADGSFEVGTSAQPQTPEESRVETPNAGHLLPLNQFRPSHPRFEHLPSSSARFPTPSAHLCPETR
jgi:hypothetical protein